MSFIVSPKSGLSYHRLINPMEFTTWEEGDSAQMLWITEEEHLIDGDILYYNKFISMSPDRIAVLKKQGMKIVVDIDDFWELPVTHPFYNQWKAAGNTQKVIDNMKLADLVICATMKLQDEVRKYNKNTAVIPNAFPFGQDVYVPILKLREERKMNFIYVAGSTHLPDVKLLEGKFKRIGSDTYLKENAKFILAGYEATYAAQYKTKEDYRKKNREFDWIKTNGVWDKMSSIFKQTGSYEVYNSVNLDEYINFYDTADVSLIPLQNSIWNSYKSELKIVEAACKGLPVICSKVEPYSNMKKDDGVLWVEHPDDWIKHIKYCVRNPSYVKEMGEKLATWIREDYDLLKWNKVRYELFKSLLKC